MFPNDDLRKDVQSWRFVKPSDTAAQVLGFVDLNDMRSYVQDFNFSFDENILVAVHYDFIEPDDDKQVQFYQDTDKTPDFFVPILHFQNDNVPEVTFVLDFICTEFPELDKKEVFQILQEGM